MINRFLFFQNLAVHSLNRTFAVHKKEERYEKDFLEHDADADRIGSAGTGT